MTEKIIRCAKCQQNAETNPRIYRSEYTITYPIRDKDGKIYCWDCYKGKSHCKGCQKSVANLKFPRSGNPYYPHASGYSIGCERIENEVEFICSKACSKKLADQKYQAWKEKLNQGWTKCKKCVKFWIDEFSNEISTAKWMKEEKNQWKIIKLLPPGQENEICCSCKPYAKDGYYHKIHQKAQKYWDSLNKEEKLAAVIRTDAVGMAKWYGETLTAEWLTEQKKVPRSIYEDFVHNQKCGGCGEEPCREERKNKNNSHRPQLAVSSELRKEQISIEIENKKNQLLKLKEEGGNPTEIAELEQEIKELLAEQNEINFSSEKSLKNNGVVPLIIGVSFLALLGIIAINSFKVKKNRNRYKS